MSEDALNAKKERSLPDIADCTHNRKRTKRMTTL
jgi:hypothetical protein